MIKLTPPAYYGITKSGGKHFESLKDFKSAISQLFGMNPDMYERFGIKGHDGIDVRTPFNTEIYASHSGNVMYIEKDINAGYGVVIHDDSKTFKTYYWHFKSWVVEKGQHVERGQLIGYADSTGYSTGHHLHWGLKRTDKKGNTLDYNNGYKGAIDPMPYLVWEPNMNYRLIREMGHDDVYRIKDGKRDLFLNGHSFEVLDGRWESIENVTQSDLDAFPEGEVLIAVPNK